MIDLDRYERELQLARRQKRSGMLANGSTGPQVKALQKLLTEKGYEVDTDGILGPETEKALREFQEDHDAQVDGIVGPETLGKLERAKGRPREKEDDPLGVLRDAIGSSKSSGSESSGGRRSSAGGSGGSRRSGGAPDSGSRSRGRGGGRGKTESQARAEREKAARGERRDKHGDTFNTAMGARADKGHPIGTTDPDKAAGNQGPVNGEFEQKHPRGPGGMFIAKGSSGESVKTTQKRLNKKGGFKLKTDGRFGPKTDAAVRDFQAKTGLVQDGVVGPKTRAALRRK